MNHDTPLTQACLKSWHENVKLSHLFPEPRIKCILRQMMPLSRTWIILPHWPCSNHGGPDLSTFDASELWRWDSLCSFSWPQCWHKCIEQNGYFGGETNIIMLQESDCTCFIAFKRRASSQDSCLPEANQRRTTVDARRIIWAWLMILELWHLCDGFKVPLESRHKLTKTKRQVS